MEENIVEEKLIPEITNSDIRKQMNHVGNALLFNTFLQIYVPIIITFIFTLIATNYFIRPTHSMYLETNFLALTTLLMIVALVIAESVPFIICAQRLKIKMSDFFRKPTMSFKTILMFSLICLGVNAFASLIVQCIDILINSNGFVLTSPDFSLGSGIINQLLTVFLLVIVAPIGEEFMLRGVCLKSLSKYGTTFSIIATSLIFSLLHGNFIQGIPTFFMGLILGYVATKSQSILPAILIHFINNAFSLIESIIANYLPWFPLAILVFLVAFALFLIIRYRSTFSIENKIENHKACWRCFFTSYSFIIFIIIYVFILAISVSPLSIYQL